MKTMNCKQLGGACEAEFRADSFDEIAELSKQHAMAMFQAKDAAHLAAMDKMRRLMEDPSAMKRWFDERKKEFDDLADN